MKVHIRYVDREGEKGGGRQREVGFTVVCAHLLASGGTRLL